MTNLINGDTGGNEPPSGCVYPSRRYRTRYEYLALDENGNLVSPFYSYSCDGCGYYGVFPVCTIKGSGDKGPAFTGPGDKPGGCKYQGSLNFDGWVLGGGEENQNASCVLSKATEGARSNSDDVIRCKFMSG
ncbi:MAG TPA: hypothetical protein VN429_12110 [Methanospirillum sp.]|uniref:hypothetical protein n=1 Tax=Methanospirillum sp. TaxID=45200 RepID=UPI002C863D68|nr:hypothetical protein [Methanospirillum sp.]HWQ65155.1 hypothetical protein [Methanospirillum sp.]